MAGIVHVVDSTQRFLLSKVYLHVSPASLLLIAAHGKAQGFHSALVVICEYLVITWSKPQGLNVFARLS